MKNVNLLNTDFLILDFKYVGYDRIFVKYLRHSVIHCLIIQVN